MDYLSLSLPTKRKGAALKGGKKKKRRTSLRAGDPDQFLQKVVQTIMKNKGVNMAQLPATYRKVHREEYDIAGSPYSSLRHLVASTDTIILDKSNKMYVTKAAYAAFPTAGGGKAADIFDDSDDDFSYASVSDRKYRSEGQKVSPSALAFQLEEERRREREREKDDSGGESADEIGDFSPPPVHKKRAVDYF